MSEKNEITFNLVISILHGLFYPIFYVWFFIVDPKFLNPILEEYSLISNYKDLWDLFRIKILFPLIYFIMCCYFAFKIIQDAIRKYKINISQLQIALIMDQSEILVTEKPKTIQERYAQVPQSEKAKMMFLIKKNQQDQNAAKTTKE